MDGVMHAILPSCSMPCALSFCGKSCAYSQVRGLVHHHTRTNPDILLHFGSCGPAFSHTCAACGLLVCLCPLLMAATVVKATDIAPTAFKPAVVDAPGREDDLLYDLGNLVASDPHAVDVEVRAARFPLRTCCAKHASCAWRWAGAEAEPRAVPRPRGPRWHAAAGKPGV